MWDLTVTNIGGIRSGSTNIKNGLNIVQASNFSGKSSLVAALQTVLGSTGHYDNHPLTEGTDEGEIRLETDKDKYNVVLERTSSGTVTQSGTPYIEDEADQICARLFACLDDKNPIRRAVRNNEDLTDLLQAPLNIEDIDAQIASLKKQKREVEQQISKAKKAGKQLPAVQETVTGLESELEGLRSRRTELAEEETNEKRIEELSNDISTKSGKLANISEDVERMEQKIERKQNQVAEKENKLSKLDIPDEHHNSHDVETMRNKIDSLDRRIDIVEDLHRANQTVIDAGEIDIITDVDHSIAADKVECWVCGQHTTKDDVKRHILQLQSTASELREKKGDVKAELEELEEQKREARQYRQKKERLQDEIQQLKADIDELKGVMTDKHKRKTELEAEVEALRDKLESAEEEYNEDLTDIKTEIRMTETKLKNEHEKLESLEQRYGELESLEEEREETQIKIDNLRNRKRNTQENLKNRFNTIIADIIEEFQPGFSSARLVLKTDQRGEIESIDIEIARDIDSRGQQTSIDTLSEGEVELIGLVVAFAGYHAFDVSSKSPCILIDGISQLAAEHLRSVATYIDDMSDVIVTTAYPEAGSFDGHVISPDEWNVVSNDLVSAT